MFDFTGERLAAKLGETGTAVRLITSTGRLEAVTSEVSIRFGLILKLEILPLIRHGLGGELW
jgi:hypothetical protein